MHNWRQEDMTLSHASLCSFYTALRISEVFCFPLEAAGHCIQPGSSGLALTTASFKPGQLQDKGLQTHFAKADSNDDGEEKVGQDKI